MKSIYNDAYAIHFGTSGYTALNEYIANYKPSVIFIIVDENTMEHCYPIFMPQLETHASVEVIEIEAGEEFKNIETCSGVWSAMVELNCDRHSLIINLGGGVITDLGGFVASTIKRGIPFVHVPTSLLGMVDAAIGGKNGVDLGAIKNQIGLTVPPVMTIVDPFYLNTLSQRQLVNGSMEMFKHGLIADRIYWNDMLEVTDYYSEKFNLHIYQSVVIKNDIAASDPFEKGARKALNYGHTIGHAIESYCMTNDHLPDLLHGEAIAAGMLVESFLSKDACGFPEDQYATIYKWFHSLNLDLNFNYDDVTGMIALMKYDKKNSNGNINFVLLERIGNFKTDMVVEESAIYLGFEELKM